MTGRRRILACVASTVVVLGIAGCSQMHALAPVGGDGLAEVRFATLDVLTAQSVPILTAPVCTISSVEEIECAGTTVDNRPITSRSPAGRPRMVTIRVGSDLLYAGTVMSVIDRAIRPAS